MFDVAIAIKVAADDVTKLRRADVFRVLDWTPAENRQVVAEYIKKERPDLAGEVFDVLDELT